MLVIPNGNPLEIKLPKMHVIIRHKQTDNSLFCVAGNHFICAVKIKQYDEDP